MRLGIANRLARLAAAVVAVLPAVLLLGYFAWLWHGLTPPMYKTGPQVHQGGNPAVPAMVLAVTGAWGMFYAGFLVPHRGEVDQAVAADRTGGRRGDTRRRRTPHLI